MNIKRNIIFALEARKKNGVAITENVPIRMRVNYSGQRIEFTMPYRIDAAKWDATKQRVKNGCTNKLTCIFHTLGKKPLIDEWHTPAKAVFSFYDKSLQP